MANDGKRFIKGSGIAKQREWRGLKDTFYDYTQWVVNLGLLVQFVGSPRCASCAVCLSTDGSAPTSAV